MLLARKVQLAGLIVVTAVWLALSFPLAANAHDLTCAKARDLANHSSAVGCYKTSPNHAWLTYPAWTYDDHVYWSHYWSIWCVCNLHDIVVVHNGH